MTEEQQPEHDQDPEPIKHSDAERVSDKKSEQVPSDDEARESADQSGAGRA